MSATFDVTPARRGLLKIAATTVAATSVCATASPAEAAADAELLALCAAWRRALDHSMATLDHIWRMHPDDRSDEDDALEEDVQRDVHELENRIFATAATTMAGIKAKAGVLAYLDAAAGIPAEREQAASLVADVLALAGGAA